MDGGYRGRGMGVWVMSEHPDFGVLIGLAVLVVIAVKAAFFVAAWLLTR